MSEEGNTQFLRIERTEAALRLSEATKTAILEAALDCIVTIDSGGLVVDWNPAAEKTFGYSAEEALGKEMAELIIPESLKPMHRAGLARAVNSGKDLMNGQRIEISARRKNGEEFPVELAITRIESGAAPLFTGHIRDISARKQAEQRRAAELEVVRVLARAASLSEAAPQIIRAVCESLSWDLGVFWRVEQGLLRCVEIWHTSRLEAEAFVIATRKSPFARGTGLPGRIWANAEPEWIPDVTTDTNFPRAVLAGENGLHGAFGFPIRLGEEVLGVIEFFSRRIREPNREVLEMFGAMGSQIGQFIERNEAEAAIYRMNSELEHRVIEATAELRASQERLRCALEHEKELSQLKTNFVNLVSHEFRTPLGVILSSADILENYHGRLTLQQRAEHLQDIRHSTKQMAGLMEEVLLLGRVEAGKMQCKPQEFDLESLCRQLIAEQVSANNSKCPIQADISPLPGIAYGDEALVRHILMNLFSNAIKYSPAGSEISFSIGFEGILAVCQIRDRGIGIPKADQPRLFEAFHRAQNVGEVPGTGLGLVIVKKCVDLHEGKIELRSEPGKGTTVTVRLPLFQVKPAFRKPTKPALKRNKTKPRHTKARRL